MMLLPHSRSSHLDAEENPFSRLILTDKKAPRASNQHRNTRRALILLPEGGAVETVYEHLDNLHENMHRAALYTCGTFFTPQRQWEVSILELEGAGTMVSQHIMQAISYFQPDIVLLMQSVVGMQDRQAGDVVSATQVYLAEDDDPETVLQANRVTWRVSASLEEQARRVAKTASWPQQSKGSIPDSALQVAFAPVIALEQVFTAHHAGEPPVLSPQQEKAVAIEQAEVGVLQAASALRHVEALVICGVAATLPASPVNDEQQRNAMRRAAAFAFALLTSMVSANNAVLTSQLGAPEEQPEQQSQILELFYSYAQEDEKLAAKLRAHISVLRQTGEIKEWYAGKVMSGADRAEYLRHLETAHLILLLVSSDYTNSDYHFKVEARRAMERHNRKEAIVVPIRLRPVSNWQSTPFRDLQPLPHDEAAIAESQNLDTALRIVVDEISKLIAQLQLQLHKEG